MAAPPPKTPLPLPDETRTLYKVIGALLLLVGFGAGFLTGRESARAPGGGAPGMVATARGPLQNESVENEAVGPVTAVHGKKRGHTFTGDIDAPPHGEQGHALAEKVLTGLTCPCGGCDAMDLAECQCDVAKEIHGLAAHLFERGKTGDAVLVQLQGHYSLEVPPEALVAARGVSAGNPHGQEAEGGGAEPSGLPSDMAGLVERLNQGKAVERPKDVPSSARPK